MDIIRFYVRKKRQQITDHEERVSGIRASQHPMVCTDITVEHLVTGHQVQPETVARITNTFRIVETEASVMS